MKEQWDRESEHQIQTQWPRQARELLLVKELKNDGGYKGEKNWDN